MVYDQKWEFNIQLNVLQCPLHKKWLGLEFESSTTQMCRAHTTAHSRVSKVVFLFLFSTSAASMWTQLSSCELTERECEMWDEWKIWRIKLIMLRTIS